MAQTTIEWTSTPRADGSLAPGYTFNAWIGCGKVSPGCKNCYAEADMAKRRKRVIWGVNGTRSVTSYSYWREALSWNRQAEAAGERRKVFCSSLADVFENWEGIVKDSRGNDLWWRSEWCQSSLKLAHTCESISGKTNYGGEKYCDVDGVPTFSHFTEDYLFKHNYDLFKFEGLTLNTIREYLFRLVEMTPNLDWLFLTKRPGNIMGMIPAHWLIKFPDNVWLGTSVENQEMAEERIPIISNVPCKVRFLSCEPLLESLDVKNMLYKNVEWVIVGGESGHGKRPFDPDWGRKIMNDCARAGVAFFMKQWDKVQSVPDDLQLRQFPQVRS